jgi:ankyrin repeat protein
MDPGSPILASLYAGKRDEAERLAENASLTVWEAAALGRDAVVRELIRTDPSRVNAWSVDGWTPLALAAFFGSPPAVRLLLDAGADVHAVARNPMLVQPLHAAVASRNAESVRLLLERGADPNARQQIGYTPLMGAAQSGLDEVVSMLLARGADPSAASDKGETAASLAAERGHAALAERLRQ